MQNLQVIENQNQRVMLTSQLAEGYGTTADTITKNFNRNKDHYQEGKHYFLLQGEDLKTFRANGQIDLLPSNLNKLYLWTEKGALLHAKSLNTDKAWQVYDELVETYFNVHNVPQIENLSPQLQLLINLETNQKQQAIELHNTNKRIDKMAEVIALDTTSWRADAHRLITKIATKLGGFEHIKDINTEINRLVDMRGGVSLSTRLTNKQQRMALEGVCKSKRDKLTKVDIIAEDKKLIEIYVAIVKEMAVKYGVTL